MDTPNFNEQGKTQRDLLIRIESNGMGDCLILDAETDVEYTNIKDVSLFYDPDLRDFVAHLEVYHPILNVLAAVEEVQLVDTDEEE